MKKLLVFVALACLLAVAPTALFEQAEAVEENGYYEYNAETGIEEYFVLQSANSRSTNIRSYEIVERDSKGNILSRTTPAWDGTDNKTAAYTSSSIPLMSMYPYPIGYEEVFTCSRVHQSIGYIHALLGTDSDGLKQWTYGTGFLEGENLLVTAGHLCYDSVDDGVDWGWTEDLVYYPGAHMDRNGNQVYPYGEEGVQRKSILVSSQWKNNGNENYDYGIVTLKTPIGETTGILGKRYQPSTYVGTDVEMISYPNLVGSYQNTFPLYESYGTVNSNTTYILECDYSAYYRSSGAPVLKEDTLIVIGIQSRADDESSYAVRITSDLYELLQEKLDEYRNSQ